MAGFAEVWVTFLPTGKGGRRSSICLGTDALGKYRPHFRVQGAHGELLGVEFVDGPDKPILPGESTYATVRFVFEPGVSYDALAVDAVFDILEGSRIVGWGRVTRR